MVISKSSVKPRITIKSRINNLPHTGKISTKTHTTFFAFFFPGNGDITQLLELNEADNSICSVRWIPEGNLLAVGDLQGQIQIWDVQGAKRIRTLQGHIDRVACMDWNKVRFAVPNLFRPNLAKSFRRTICSYLWIEMA